MACQVVLITSKNSERIRLCEFVYHQSRHSNDSNSKQGHMSTNTSPTLKTYIHQPIVQNSGEVVVSGHLFEEAYRSVELE